MLKKEYREAFAFADDDTTATRDEWQAELERVENEK